MDDVTATQKRARVLLVEDEPQICDIATEALEEQGFDGAGPTIAQEDERSRRGRRHGTSRRRFHARHCHMRASTAVALVPVRRR